MTMWADKGMCISTVIVMVAVENLLFQPVGQERGCTAKMVRDALASMALVYTNALLQGSSRSLEPSKMRLTA